MLSRVLKPRGGEPSTDQGAQPVVPAYPRVGPYRLCLKLAAGGMATVYLARREAEHGPGRMVALKLIHPHLATDREFIDMFKDEAELAAMIRHPNVCGVLDYDLRHDEPYLVMEYLVGESLMSVAHALEHSTDFDPIRLSACVARMLADACEGLHAAHELADTSGEPLQVVHRDVSLENVFVTYDGVAKLMDFGVAAAANKRHQTRTGVLKGKFASVAPECLKGHRPDRRADVWGIGVIAWELLTGQRLFRRETEVDTLFAVSEAPIQRPSECRPGLPAAFDEIVMRALERDPDKRYATARELGRDFARFSARGGEVLTSADVAEWLRELFPGGRERRLEVLDAAARLDSSGDPASADDAQPSASLPPALPSMPSRGRTGSDHRLGGRRASAPPPPPRGLSGGKGRMPTLPARRHSLWLTALVVFLSAATGGLMVIVAQSYLQRLGGWPAARWAPDSGHAPPTDSAHAVVNGTQRTREVVLRIRIDTADLNAPTTTVEAGTSETAARASAPPPDMLGDEPRVLVVDAR
jgi:serine/threonine-protein kinase